MNPAILPRADEGVSPASITPVVLHFKTKQIKTKVAEIVKRRKDGSEIVFWEVRVGSAIAKVYFTPSGERELFTLAYWCKRRLKSAAGVMCVTRRFKSAASSLTMKHVSQYERLD